MVLWWIGNAILVLAVIPLVLYVAKRIIRRILEIRRYGADIAEHGAAIDRNLEPASALVETRERVGDVRSAATRYLGALDDAA